MNLANLIALAARHMNNDMPMRSSAVACYNDAIITQSKGMEASARKWAIKSLQYSLGILHPTYQLADADLCEVYNSEDGTVLEGSFGITYEIAVRRAAEFSHKPNFFRVRPYSGNKSNPPFSCGAN